jgi:hypothetical protein
VGSRNVLVVSTVDHPEDALRGEIGPADHVKVVVPVVKQGVLDWLSNDERAFAHAASVADATAERLAAEDVQSAAGEADVGLAIQDALATFPADEIVVALHPDEVAEVTDRLDPDDGAARSVGEVPVRFVVIRGGG